MRNVFIFFIDKLFSFVFGVICDFIYDEVKYFK